MQYLPAAPSSSMTAIWNNNYIYIRVTDIGIIRRDAEKFAQ